MKYTRKYSKFSSHEIVISRLPDNHDVLDIGSSSGLISSEIKSKNCRLTCIDLENPLNVSKNIDRYIQADLERYSDIVIDGSYDYIIMADIVEHIRDAEGLLQYVSQLLRNKDSIIIVSVPNIAIWYYRLSLLFGEFNYNEKGTLDYSHVHFYTRKTIINLLKEVGYKPIWIGYSNIPFEIVFPYRRHARLASIMDRLYRFFVLLWPTMFSYQFVIEVRKE